MEEEKRQGTDNFLVGWEIPEYETYERSKRWYLWAGMIFGLMLIYGLYTTNFLFVVILVLAAVTITFRSVIRPDLVEFKIFDDGIAVGSKFYQWKDIDKFYIIYEPPEVKNLYFSPKGFRSRISIPLLKQNPLKVREVLLKYLVEDLEEENEPLSEAYSRFLKL